MKKIALAIVSIVAGVVLMACGLGDRNDVVNPNPVVTSTQSVNTHMPQLNNFELTPKTISKQCFGEFGCNLEVKIQVAYDGPKLSSDDIYEVTYSLSGDESGPIIGTFNVTGTEYSVNTEFLSTRSNSTKVSAKVTSIEKIR